MRVDLNIRPESGVGSEDRRQKTPNARIAPIDATLGNPADIRKKDSELTKRGNSLDSQMHPSNSGMHDTAES